MSVVPIITLPAGGENAGLDEGSILFVGTATLLIRYAGFTILTDPNFVHRHEKVSVAVGIDTTRLTDPALDIADLPPIDLIVLSHFHGDHFDQVAQRDLDKGLPIVTPPQAAAQLNALGFYNTISLETWQSVEAVKGDARLRITATPGKHGPGLVDLVLPDVMGSIWEFSQGAEPPRYRMYITGDTLIFDDIHEIPQRHPDIDLAMLHLGGTIVLGILVTMDDKQGVEMLEIVQPKMAIPIHYNDYDLFKSPLSDFQQRVREAGWEDRVTYLAHGDSYTFAGRKQGAK